MDAKAYRMYAGGHSYGNIGRTIGVSATAAKERLRVIPRMMNPNVKSCPKCRIPFVTAEGFTYCIECGSEG